MNRSELLRLVHYDPETGEFTWAVGRPGASKGGICGRVSVHGYREIGIGGKLCRAHRLAFLYMTGGIPEEIDHVNLDRLDNRWSNLRACTKRENAGNVAGKGASGIKGVHFDSERGKWCAQIRDHGRKKNLGRYDTEMEAAAAYATAATVVFGDFARL